MEKKEEFMPVAFTQDEFNKICLDTKTGYDTKHIDRKGKYATPEQIKDVFKLNLEMSHTLTVLHNLNVANPVQVYKDHQINPNLPKIEPKNPDKNKQTAKNVANTIEKTTKGLQID